MRAERRARTQAQDRAGQAASGLGRALGGRPSPCSRGESFTEDLCRRVERVDFPRFAGFLVLEMGNWDAGGGRKESSEADTHLADPVDVGGHPGEDRGLLESVAAQPGAEADDAPHLPGAVLRLAVQRASRVSLHQAGQVSGPRLPPEAGLGSRRGSG